MTESPFFNKQILAGILFLVATFIIDMLTPLGMAIGVMYVVSIFIVSRQRRRVVLLFGIAASILTVVQLGLNYTSDTSYMVLVNRAMSISTIIIGTLLAFRYNTLEAKAKKEKEEYINSIEQMLFMTSHKVRKPVSSCLGLMNILELPDTKEADMRQALVYLKLSAYELDDFTRELTTFIEKINTQHKRHEWYNPILAA